MATLKELKLALEEFLDKYRKPGLPPLELSKLYTLFPEKTGTKGFDGRMWPKDDYPGADGAGVYVILTEGLDILHIGKASMTSTVGGRLGSYFGYTRDRRCKVRHKWTREPVLVATIPVSSDMPWEAPALEEFLILRLHPEDNSLGW